jgi:hypothetical protein
MPRNDARFFAGALLFAIFATTPLWSRFVINEAEAALPNQPLFKWQLAVAIQPERYTFNLYCSDDGDPVTQTQADLKFPALPWNPVDGESNQSQHLSALGDFPPGTYECRISTVLTGIESDMSNAVSFSVPLAAPINLIVE